MTWNGNWIATRLPENIMAAPAPSAETQYNRNFAKPSEVPQTSCVYPEILFSPKAFPTVP